MTSGFRQDLPNMKLRVFDAPSPPSLSREGRGEFFRIPNPQSRLFQSRRPIKPFQHGIDLKQPPPLTLVFRHQNAVFHQRVYSGQRSGAWSIREKSLPKSGQDLGVSQAKLRVRTKTDKSQCAGIRLAVDQHEIGFHVAISMVFPVADQRMIAMPRFQREIGQQRGQDSVKVGI
jgi:hypothetical protein